MRCRSASALRSNDLDSSLPCALAPHGEVHDGLAVLEEPSADVRQPYSLPRPHGPSGRRRGRGRGLSISRNASRGMSTRRPMLNDGISPQVIESYAPDRETPSSRHLVDRERQSLVQRVPRVRSSLPRSSVTSSSPTYRGSRAPTAAPNAKEIAKTTHMHQRFVDPRDFRWTHLHRARCSMIGPWISSQDR